MAYNKLAVILDRYNTSKVKKGFIGYNSIDATTKWVEYSLDVLELKKVLPKSDFNTRFDIMKALKTAESKVDYMYRHKNFDINEAVASYKRAKRLLAL
jgi:hypothetical protein